jgi:hypothetical protein
MIDPLRLTGSVLSGAVDGKQIFCVLAAGVRIPPGDYWLFPMRDPALGSMAKMIPSQGDQVLVAFDHGDPRRPYVTGGLWNGSDTPPESTFSLSDAKTAHRNNIHVVVGLQNLIDVLKRPVRVKVS